MRLLLDTHISLWALADDPRLPARARALIADPDNSVNVSAVSVWEVAIKHRLHPAEIAVSGTEVLTLFHEAAYGILAILPTHAAAVDALPDIHKDPFDRLLVAQAQSESMHLVTHDATVARYGGLVLWV